MTNTSTIFAPLTVKGKCSVYVIRISGPEVRKCLGVLGIRNKLEHRRATLCTLRDENGGELDRALVTYFEAPNSFTGEDVCELNLHCSTYIINTVFSILNNLEGVRIAENGEFSKRAFLNNKLDLLQVESIVDLVDADTKLQHEQAMRQLRGENSLFFEKIRKNILDITSSLEALIDFPEDDLDVHLLQSIKTSISDVIATIKKALGDNNVGEKVKGGLNISIMGEPNVGKSSLFNFLAKRDAAIVSDVAGTTRDILEISVDIGGMIANFFDTAGIRNTDNPIESEGIKRALARAENSDIKILIVSPESLDITADLKKLIDEKTLIVLNKIDLIKNEEFKKIKLLFPNVIGISLKERINVDLIIDYIRDYTEKTITPHIGTNLTQERHRTELTKSLNCLLDTDFNLPIEIIAENVRCAGFCIGKITGLISTDEILDNIFSKFCIGK